MSSTSVSKRNLTSNVLPVSSCNKTKTSFTNKNINEKMTLKSFHAQKKWPGRPGQRPAGGGVRTVGRGDGPAGGGVRIFCRGGGPAGGGVKIFCRGDGPAGGGVKTLAGANPGPRRTLEKSKILVQISILRSRY